MTRCICWSSQIDVGCVQTLQPMQHFVLGYHQVTWQQWKVLWNRPFQCSLNDFKKINFHEHNNSKQNFSHLPMHVLRPRVTKHRTTSRCEWQVTGRFAPSSVRLLDVFKVSSTFPAYSVKTQACISARCAHRVRWHGAVFRDTLLQPSLAAISDLAV